MSNNTLWAAEKKAAALGRRKSPPGLFDGFLQSAACIICSLLANKFHACSLRSIFCQVHALTENASNLVFRLREKFCEAFSTVWGS